MLNQGCYIYIYIYEELTENAVRFLNWHEMNLIRNLQLFLHRRISVEEYIWLQLQQRTGECQVNEQTEKAIFL